MVDVLHSPFQTKLTRRDSPPFQTKLCHAWTSGSLRASTNDKYGGPWVLDGGTCWLVSVDVNRWGGHLDELIVANFKIV